MTRLRYIGPAFAVAVFAAIVTSPIALADSAGESCDRTSNASVCDSQINETPPLGDLYGGGYAGHDVGGFGAVNGITGYWYW